MLQETRSAEQEKIALAKQQNLDNLKNQLWDEIQSTEQGKHTLANSDMATGESPNFINEERKKRIEELRRQIQKLRDQNNELHS